MENIKITSNFDGLELDVAYTNNKKPKAIIIFSHGMSEHKERYYNFIEYLSINNYLCVIHDHRGHGKSVKQESDLGDFYTTKIDGIVEDLKQVVEEFQNRYPGINTYMFAHSMGTLVARCFMQKYDNLISKIVLSGTPTKNGGAKIGLRLAKRLNKKAPDKEAKALNALTFANASSISNIPNGWLCANKKTVEAYNLDPYCGFIFKPSGFINLFTMLINSYNKKLYQMNNKSLDIFIVAGMNDPIINSVKKFHKLKDFLIKLGYENTTNKLYIKMRHEILNESGKALVYQDILAYYDK